MTMFEILYKCILPKLLVESMMNSTSEKRHEAGPRCKEGEAASERRYRSSRRCCNGGHGANNNRSVSNTADTAGKTQRLTARLRRRVVMLT